MNKARRKKIQNAWDLLTEALEEEQEAFDNMPESLQEGEKGYAMQDNISKLEEAISTLEGFVE